MPFRNRRSGKKKRNQPKIRNSGLVVLPAKNIGIARSVQVVLHYQELAFTNAATGYLTIRGNDIFDPNATSSGMSVSGNQQPSYYDKWATMYNKYRVLSSSASANIAIAGAGPATCWTLTPEDQLVTTANATQASVAPYAKHKITNYVYQPSFFLRSSMTTSRINGISTAEVLINPNYQAAINNTPADPWYWQLRYSALDGVTVVPHYVLINFSFTVLFTDPVQDDDNDLYRAINRLRLERQSPIGLAPLSLPVDNDEKKDITPNSISPSSESLSPWPPQSDEAYIKLSKYIDLTANTETNTSQKFSSLSKNEITNDGRSSADPPPVIIIGGISYSRVGT